MPHPGQKFSNPSTGELVELLETSRETQGRYVRFRTTLPQGKGFEVAHIHTSADETFEVVSGQLSYKLGKESGKIGAGDSITLPRGQAHAHWNADPEPLVMIQTISPCYDTDRFLETLFGLAIDGKLSATGQPPFLQIMLWIRELESKTYLAAIPQGVQNFLAVVLSPLAKRLGYRSFYEKYAA